MKQTPHSHSNLPQVMKGLNLWPDTIRGTLQRTGMANNFQEKKSMDMNRNENVAP